MERKKNGCGKGRKKEHENNSEVLQAFLNRSFSFHFTINFFYHSTRYWNLHHAITLHKPYIPNKQRVNGMRIMKPGITECKLKPWSIKLEVGVEHNGKRKLWEECHSFSRWANRWFINSLIEANTTITQHPAPIRYTPKPIKNISGVEKPWWDGINSTLDYWRMPQKAFFFLTKAIAIGSSNEAWDYDQYELLGKIMEATTYTRRTDITETDGSLYLEFEGIFDIQTSTTINETGLYGQFMSGDNAEEKFLVSRDVLSTGIPVSPGDVIVVIYRLTVG